MKLKDVLNRADLAVYLGIPLKYLTYLLYEKKIDNLYSQFEIPKKNGGVRYIKAPDQSLKPILKNLSNKLNDELSDIRKANKTISNISHGFEKDKSIMTNASKHINKKYIMNVDLKDFFETIHFGRVRGYFQKNRYFDVPENIATMIAQLTCYKGCLAQGAPTSPVISNLICNILDIRISKLANKYRLDYTRYVDDLTFSTNDKKIGANYKEFLKSLEELIVKAGFKINQKKTRLDDNLHRQTVTGLVVNKKVNINREFYRLNRAMANSLYKTGSFKLNDEKGTILQLEGRFSFVDQIVKRNNKLDKENRHDFFHLNGIEKEYQKLIFYKYFYAFNKPLIVTEGKTDILYLKAALKNLGPSYKELVSMNNNSVGNDYQISFLNRTKRLQYFLNLQQNGADTFKNIYHYYSKAGGKNYLNYMAEFINLSNNPPLNPVILLFDNEAHDKKPLNVFLRYINRINDFEDFIRIKHNLYLLKVPNLTDKDDVELENLFLDELLQSTIYGKKVSLEDSFDSSKFIGKHLFSKYVYENYKTIDFTNFKPLFNSVIGIIEDYQRLYINDEL